MLLIRHGESEWNAVGRWQGWADPPLTDLGFRQAKAAARSVGAVYEEGCTLLALGDAAAADALLTPLGVRNP